MGQGSNENEKKSIIDSIGGPFKFIGVAIAGLGSFFVFTGLFVIQSYTQSMGIYGLTDLNETFSKQAGMDFVIDMLRSLKIPSNFPTFFVVLILFLLPMLFRETDKKFKPKFFIDADFEKTLNDGNISEKLHDEFKKHECPLSSKPSISLIEGDEWRVCSDDNEYKIKRNKEKKNLEVSCFCNTNLNKFLRRFSVVMPFVILICSIVVLIFTSNLEYTYSKFFNKSFLYTVSIPAVIALCINLVFYAKDANKTKTIFINLLYSLLVISLLVSISIGYGSNIYDTPIYLITEVKTPPESEIAIIPLLEGLLKGPHYLVGGNFGKHRIILEIDNNSHLLFLQAIDNDYVKYLVVSKQTGKQNTLRWANNTTMELKQPVIVGIPLSLKELNTYLR